MKFLNKLWLLFTVVRDLSIYKDKDTIAFQYKSLFVIVEDREVSVCVNGLLKVDPMFLSLAEDYYGQMPEGHSQMLQLYREISGIEDEQEREKAYRQVCSGDDPRYRSIVEGTSTEQGTNTVSDGRTVVRVL